MACLSKWAFEMLTYSPILKETSQVIDEKNRIERELEMPPMVQRWFIMNESCFSILFSVPLPLPSDSWTQTEVGLGGAEPMLLCGWRSFDSTSASEEQWSNLPALTVWFGAYPEGKICSGVTLILLSYDEVQCPGYSSRIQGCGYKEWRCTENTTRQGRHGPKPKPCPSTWGLLTWSVCLCFLSEFWLQYSKIQFLGV